jgi:hypothetical protein
MKEKLKQFIEEGLVYRGNKHDFLLLKDLIEFVRKTNLKIKIKDLQIALTEAGWSDKKASVLTDKGYQSKDIWFINERVELVRALPIKTRMRLNLIEAEEKEADRLIEVIFDSYETIVDSTEALINEKELVFTNKGLKLLLIKMHARGSISKLSSIIRKRANKILVGEHFFGTSSRTILFKNYYRLRK